MVLQYVAESFHLPSESTANSKNLQQFEIPSVPAVVISTMLLHQSNIMAASVHSNSTFFSVSPVLPTYSNNYVTHFTVYSVW
jgi:hypothetical protein